MVAERERRARARTVLAEEAVEAPARAGRLAAVHAALDRFWAALEGAAPLGPDAPWRAQFGTAVGEIAANIVRHAHPEGTSPGLLRLRLRGFAEGVEAEFSDHGVPYDGDLVAPAAPPEVPEDADDLLALPEGGYGLAIVLAAVDRLEYSRTPSGVNHWRLFKRLPA